MILPFVILESSRLILTNFELSDSADIFDFCSNPEVTKYLSWYPHKEVVESERFILKSIEENQNSITSKLWAIRLKENMKAIGVVRVFDFSPSNKRIEVSYILNPSFQGKGYIHEALEAVIEHLIKLGIKRIQAKCSDDNLASEKVLLKLNMKFEGLLYNFWIFKGIPINAKSFSSTL